MRNCRSKDSHAPAIQECRAAGATFHEGCDMIQQTFEDVSDEYADFVKKFQPKKTTDDCYTPKAVYDAVLKWVAARYSLAPGAIICRPFWPDGDYERFHYTHGCFVIDNPPFSIIGKIVKFYMARQIRFFLFNNGLTLFNCYQPGVGFVIIRRSIVFENGANVDCGFVTNLGENAIEVAPELDAAIQDANNGGKPELPKYVYPDSVISAATAKRLCREGVRFEVRHGEVMLLRSLDEMGKRTIFGGGLLLSKRAAKERARAEAEAAERCGVYEWKLSARERELQELLSAGAI